MKWRLGRKELSRRLGRIWRCKTTMLSEFRCFLNANGPLPGGQMDAECPNTKKCNINQPREGLEQCIKVMDVTSRFCCAFARRRCSLPPPNLASNIRKWRNWRAISGNASTRSFSCLFHEFHNVMEKLVVIWRRLTTLSLLI